MVSSALAAGLALTLTGTSVTAQPSISARAARDERLTGTVTAVDSRARTLDLLTGVGYALRVRRVHWTPQATLTARGAEVVFSRLTPGSIVRLECRTTGVDTQASGVEILKAAPASRSP